MLRLEDFNNVKFQETNLINGGEWVSTPGGSYQVLLQTFDCGSDSQETDGENVTTRLHCISNSTFNDGSGAYEGPC